MNAGLALGLSVCLCACPVLGQEAAKTAAVSAIADRPYLGAARSVRKALSGIVPPGWEASPLEVFPDPRLSGDSFLQSLVAFGFDAQTARILDEFGLQTIARRAFHRGQRHLHVNVYQFSVPAGAFGAYNFLRQGASTVVVRGDGSSEDDTNISFWKGDFFVKLSQTSEEDDESKDALNTIANNLLPAITSTAQMPQILRQLPVMDRVRGTEKLVMGPNSGRQFFPAPFVDNLSLERSRGAAIADYQFSSPPDRMKLLFVDYADPAVAQDVYQRYVDSFGSQKGVSQGQTEMPTVTFKLSNGYLLCQLRGSKLAIITGARKRISPLLLTRQIP